MAHAQYVETGGVASGGKNQSSKEAFLWDEVVPELAERRRGKTRTWVVQTRVLGKTLRRKIGDVEALYVVAARELARERLAELRKEQASAVAPDSAVTLSGFAERFFEDCAHQWRPRTLRSHRKGMETQTLPYLGSVRVTELTRDQVIQWQASMTSYAAGTKNRALAVLSSLMRHAELVGLRPPGSNPCAGLRRHQSEFKADYLDAAGYAALEQVLQREADRFPLAVPFVRFVTLTGCRRSEAKSALWEQLDNNRLALPESKTGAKSIWLGKASRTLLASLPRHGRGIFSGDDPRKLENEIKKLWPLVRDALGKPSFRLHDLRHSAASVGVNMGFSLQVIGGLLGHSDMDSTAGYAHLDHDQVARASERVGTHLKKAMTARPSRKGSRGRKGKLSTVETVTPAPYRRAREGDLLAFSRGGQGLHKFCSEHAIDPDHFLKMLQAWRRGDKNKMRMLTVADQ